MEQCQIGVISREGRKRVIDYAFKLAINRKSSNDSGATRSCSRGKYKPKWEDINVRANSCSAPKYKGLNRANPIATIWAEAMLLEFLGEKDAVEAIVKAIQINLKEGKVKNS